MGGGACQVGVGSVSILQGKPHSSTLIWDPIPTLPYDGIVWWCSIVIQNLWHLITHDTCLSFRYALGIILSLSGMNIRVSSLGICHPGPQCCVVPSSTRFTWPPSSTSIYMHILLHFFSKRNYTVLDLQNYWLASFFFQVCFEQDYVTKF